jgi:hypothetical protein
MAIYHVGDVVASSGDGMPTSIGSGNINFADGSQQAFSFNSFDWCNGAGGAHPEAGIGDSFGLNRLVSDLASNDFERLRTSLARTLGPVSLGNEIQRVRTVFKYAYDEGLIERPWWSRIPSRAH